MVYNIDCTTAAVKQKALDGAIRSGDATPLQKRVRVTTNLTLLASMGDVAVWATNIDSVHCQQGVLPKQVVTLGTRWGPAYEEEARKVYLARQAQHHVNLKVAQCGFVINPLFPQVGFQWTASSCVSAVAVAVAVKR